MWLKQVIQMQVIHICEMLKYIFYWLSNKDKAICHEVNFFFENSSHLVARQHQYRQSLLQDASVTFHYTAGHRGGIFNFGGINQALLCDLYISSGSVKYYMLLYGDTRQFVGWIQICRIESIVINPYTAEPRY